MLVKSFGNDTNSKNIVRGNLREIDEQKLIWNALRERNEKCVGYLMKKNAWITTMIQWKTNENTGQGRAIKPFKK